ncbi:DUF1176 domain-containing protein [Duganella sp. sic0402]|uniref:DUF1176 domain-containing protein n=1 Tax=Duganella sp. sic0402 TaxID=2854786 RepID=UPI001C459A42|nr:DUF1176 domain-containing protein [Duganella sp. sic0402]MBV7539025.1 DUF1176 domain-containing protein [Duganella sp. sic0402]
MRRALLALGALLFAGAQAGEFVHKDWAVACDNTRHCEAVGYQDMEQGAPVTLWLGRDAGGNAPVLGKLMAYSEDDSEAPLSIRVGEVQIKAIKQELTAQQMARLLPALKKADTAQVSDGKRAWTLSLAGLNAALLKMDDVQGRVGTVTALARAGVKPASAVPAALPAPVLRALPLPPQRDSDKALLPAILDVLKDADCEAIASEGAYGDVYRISATQLLVVRQCWLGAYQGAYGVWRVDDKPPYAAVRLMLPGADGKEEDAAVEAYFENGILSSYAKGRGLGDCGGFDSWLWTADGFKLLESSNGPLCRGMPGGGFMLRSWIAQQAK